MDNKRFRNKITYTDSKSLLLESLFLEEVRYSCPLFSGHCLQNSIGRVKIPPHDCCLVFKD